MGDCIDTGGEALETLDCHAPLAFSAQDEVVCTRQGGALDCQSPSGKVVICTEIGVDELDCHMRLTEGWEEMKFGIFWMAQPMLGHLPT